MSAKHDVIWKWIEKADQDLGTAKLTYLHIPEFRETIAFHCQQAVEKYLKSFLFFLDIPLTRTHDLGYLLGLVSMKDPVAVEIYNKAAELEDFAVEIRYPDTIIVLTNEDIERAIQIAIEFRSYVLEKMKLDEGVEAPKK